MPKVIDYIEYTKTENGWTSRKVHDSTSPDGEFVMEHGLKYEPAIREDVQAIEAGKRPAWTLLGLPQILVNGEVFKDKDQV